MNVKSIGHAMLGLLIVLIALMVTLHFLQKIPVIGKAAGVAHNLATDGTL